MSELSEKVATSIERLKAFEPEEGYYLSFSGGKDSVVCKALLDMSGCKYDATYRVTSVDPPELVRFIIDKHPDVKREVPRYPKDYKNEKLAGKPINMWNLMPEKLMPPTRRARYCCEWLKESGGDGRKIVTGVRWAESAKRKQNQGIATFFPTANRGMLKIIGDDSNFLLTKSGGVVLTNDNADSRRMVEQCYRRSKVTINPIIDWEDKDVWNFIKGESIPYCTLYDEGFLRLGCIGCPLARRSSRERELARWPEYKNAYLLSFQKIIQARIDKGKPCFWNTPIDVYNWWMENRVMIGQYNLFEDYEEDEVI